jgi:hypothetical protein
MPAGDGIVFKYGDYEFDPRPLFSVNKEMIKTPSNTGLGTKYSLTLNGNILPTGIDPIDRNKAGLTTVFSDVNSLRDAFAQDFRLLLLQCNEDAPLISGYPKVIGIDTTHAGDNYVQRSDYTITLELPSLTGSVSESGGIACNGSVMGDISASGLLSVTDDFTVEFLDERIGGDISIAAFGSIPSVFSIQRTLAAQGDSRPCGDGTYVEPWERAKNYVGANLGLTYAMTGLSNLMCVAGMNLSNNFRSISVNKSDGSVSSTETWIAYTGEAAATEEFEISTERSLEDPLTSVTVNGTIQGLTTIDYSLCPPTGVPKFNNALTKWTNVSGALASRAQAVYNSLPAHSGNPAGSLNIIPLTEGLGYNIVGGTVTYNYSYNDRPVNCYSGALKETITFSYTEPNDIFASLTILGRSQGPLLQDISTVGPRTRSISIDAIIPITPCDFDTAMDTNRFLDPPPEYDTLVDSYRTLLNFKYETVFVSSYTKGWEPKAGHFTLNKSWTVGDC